MNRNTSGRSGIGSLAAGCLALTIVGQAFGQGRTFTTDADFDEGVLTQVNHDAPNQDQLQLDLVDGTTSFIGVALSGRGTVVRIDAETGEILGEYATGPQGRPLNPSRCTVDANGNLWAGNRDDDPTGLSGSVVKVGIVIGGTRVDATGTPDPNGGYLAPPFAFSTAVDRDGDGLIRTSMGSGDVLAWPDVTDGAGGAGGGPALVEDAVDEAILVYQRTAATQNRQISIDGSGQVWVGGYPQSPQQFDVLNPTDGSILSNLPLGLNCGGFAGEFDAGGILWSSSFFEDTLLRHDPVGGTVTCIATQLEPSGVVVDSTGNVWVAGSSELRRYDSAGTQTGAFPIAGSAGLFAITQHPADGHLWVTSFDTDEVYRVDLAGSVVATIPVGDQPSGVAIDSNGKVWVTNNASDDAMRIDRATNAVDLTVSLGAGAQPFNPSQDMVGFVSASGLAPIGTWSVVHDGGAANIDWTQVAWSSSELAGSTIAVEARAANSPGALAGQSFVSVANGASTGLNGQLLELNVTFRTVDGTTSPVLFDLTVDGMPGGNGDDCVTVDRRTPSSLLLFPEFDSREGILSVFTVTHTDCAGDDVDVEFVYVDGDDCGEFNRTETLTPCDQLTGVVSAHDPNQTRGYMYCFAKDPATGEAISADVLVGQMLILNGFEHFEYSTNAVGFHGLGVEGLTDVNGDGRRDLDGVEYAQAADEFLIPRFLGQTEGFSAAAGRYLRGELVLVDLTGGRDFTTVLDFLVYNDNEEVFSAEHSFECWDRVPLLDISGVFGNQFLSN
ncbi:MAG: hypothetical protein KDC14_08310, partial [Planctomycetes bacterium]|nr:hypothetical protein [Planctomycetota bacterium]